jgi:hypothetical protein
MQKLFDQVSGNQLPWEESVMLSYFVHLDYAFRYVCDHSGQNLHDESEGEGIKPLF